MSAITMAQSLAGFPVDLVVMPLVFAVSIRPSWRNSSGEADFPTVCPNVDVNTPWNQSL
jgi:hypothetical protein